jgi:polysaccharide export outer membrane protein
MTNYSDYRIRTDDVLAIGISTAGINQEQLIPFAQVIKDEEGKEARQALPNYTVDTDGNIQLPLVGKVRLQGLTRKEAQMTLEQRLADFISKPSVSVLVKNFSVTVLGEVKQPGRHPMPNTNANLLDAIAAAGDLTPYGDRKQLLLMRQNAVGETEFSRLDLTSAANFMNQESFQLQQNDVLYVPTNKRKILEATTDTQKKYQTYSLILAAITTFTVIANLIIAVR